MWSPGRPETRTGCEFDPTGGLISRSAATGGTGALGSSNVRWADAPTDRLAYRLSAGVFASDPFERPTGVSRRSRHPSIHR